MFVAHRAHGVLAVLGMTVVLSVAVTAPAVAAGVDVTIDRHRTVSMPGTLQPGVNTFRITSKRESAFQLAKHRRGYGAREAARDIRRGLEHGQVRELRRFERNVTLYGGVTSTPDRPGRLNVELKRGRYWAIDTNGPVDPGDFFRFRVEGADTGLTMPDVKTVKAVREADWARLPRAVPHAGMLGFANRSEDNHFVSMAKLRHGKTLRDFKRWIHGLESGQGGPSPVNFRFSYDTGVNSPGVVSQTNLRLPKGRYVMTCFWPDADHHAQPHAFMGMIRAIRLT